ncbi:hypothetical protein FA15DRAFT_627434 [Coprinopsis marcescibilis]|uniref:Mitochondrial outer membrane protein IML2 n=1 Tax=Coprinopsis marcescibilis TaxID=230819 RepID=A0A5C3KFR2_COPMA|nr:hypothetical protein FA15DRAFT_627434 [Coprinopsis marcescibilis]
MANQDTNLQMLESATKGFDYLFANDIEGARKHFAGSEDPFHLMGAGTIAFLEAALGMETHLVTEASRCLALSEAGAKRQIKVQQSSPSASLSTSRFPAGLEWEIVSADAVVLLGLTNALSESYMGYLQCMYSLNSAHSKFTKLYKTVFPNGIDEYILQTQCESQEGAGTVSSPPTPPPSGANHLPSASTANHLPNGTLQVPAHLKHKASFSSLASIDSTSTTATTTGPLGAPKAPTPQKSFFSRWLGSAAAASEPALPLTSGLGYHHGHAQHVARSRHGVPDGKVEEMIVAGTAFGYGLFNLIFSLLPKKIQSLVGFLGFQHDRQLALKALKVAEARPDVHGVFAGLVLMTYHGLVLLLSGYQADEARVVELYKGIVERVEKRYPDGALWILNRAKILRMSHDAEGAIKVLQDGLKPERPHSFAQADMMLLFELAWTLLGQRRYQESADSFMKITELNTWSHATYYFLSAGCYFALGKLDQAQALLNAIPGLIDKKKVGGKDLPTEVFIKKKLAFYRENQARRGGDEDRFIEAVRISPAQELAIFWNTHARIDKAIAKEYIAEVVNLTPALNVKSGVVDDIRREAANGGALASSQLAVSPVSPPNTAATATTIFSSSSSTFASSSATATANPTSPSTSLPDLDTPDELAVRCLLLGICHRTMGEYRAGREFLLEACGYQQRGGVRVNTWVGGLAMFELAVLELKEVEAIEKAAAGGAAAADGVDWVTVWLNAMKSAEDKLDYAVSLSPNTVDLSSRLDSRISMLRDEMVLKREMLGVGGRR